MRRARTREAYAEVEPMALALRQTGLSLKGIAKQLNVTDNRTQRGTLWTDVAVMRLLRRARDAQPIMCGDLTLSHEEHYKAARKLACSRKVEACSEGSRYSDGSTRNCRSNTRRKTQSTCRSTERGVTNTLDAFRGLSNPLRDHAIQPSRRAARLSVITDC